MNFMPLKIWSTWFFFLNVFYKTESLFISYSTPVFFPKFFISALLIKTFTDSLSMAFFLSSPLCTVLYRSVFLEFKFCPHSLEEG